MQKSAINCYWCYILIHFGTLGDQELPCSSRITRPILGAIMDFKTLIVMIVLACLAAGTLAGPVMERQCAKECNSRDDEGMFRAFKSYYFSYAVDIDSRITGRNSDQSSTVRVEATAVIEGLSACDKMLKLSDISILERRQDGIMVAAETASTFSETLTGHPLRFSMESNGTITSVCPEAGEETWALNVKRGFLSHIQTKRRIPNNVLEEDDGVFEASVAGICMPVYSATGARTFIKSNDYLMCKYRTNLNLFLDVVPLHPNAPPVSPLTSRMECEYTVDRQGISSIECYETHTLKPFAESDSRPETVVHTVITKIDVRPTITSSLRSKFARRTSLLYEDSIQVSEINSDDVRNTISHICDSITDGISSETPSLFEKLTKQFGELDNNNLNTIINQLYGICPHEDTYEVMNMVKDALIDCDTEQCAQGFHSIVRSENSVENEFYLRKWFMKLVFHKNPTKNMINLVKHYVSGSQDVNLPAYYALSSMIHQYCRMSEDECSRERDILNAAIIFEDNLHVTCLPESEEDRKQILMSLRAIGNMGLIQSESLLSRCNRDQNPNQLRVAAIEAYRRSSCDVVPIDRFMRIFSTIDNDSELRIAAYRAIIRCPSAKLLQSIANTIAIEPNDQVSCYVSSHLANIRNSPDPMLAGVLIIISQSPLANVTSCDMDYKKFSNNYRLSYFDDESDNGIHFDSDVIFSSKSYLPRSVRLAMNVDLFGYGLNLFELDGRTEGWEEALKSVFNPGEEDQLANLIQKVKWMMKKHASTALSKIHKKYESSSDLEQDGSEQAAIGTKVLGNDLFFKDQDDFLRMAQMFSRERFMKLIASLATQRTHEYSLNKILKTSKVTIPTMAGMPLEVNVQGAVNVIFKVSGKLDIMMAKPMKVDIQGLFEPSAAIEIFSNMMVDAKCARSGLSHKTNLASSLSVGGRVSLENGMFGIKINAPPSRETIISASSTLYFIQRDEMVEASEPEYAMLTHEPIFSTPRYNIHISGTRPRMPFSLPGAFLHNWRLEITLDKLEESLVSYDLEAGIRTDTAFRNGGVEKTDHVHLLIGAPGSGTIGVYSVDMAYHRSNTTLIISAGNPWESRYFIGSLRNEPNCTRLRLKNTVSSETVLLEVGMDTIPITNGVKYVPTFVITMPRLNVTLDGYVSYVGEKTMWDFTLADHFLQKELVMKGNFIKNSTLRLASLHGHGDRETFSLEGGYRVEETSSSMVIIPIFSFNTSRDSKYVSYNRSVSIGGGPVVISDEGVTMNELVLVSTRDRRAWGATYNSTKRLIEVSNLKVRQSGFRFRGKFEEETPFSANFDMTNDDQYSLELTFQRRWGEVNTIRGILFNISSDFIYRLEIMTLVNGTKESKLITEFKNEVNALQYLETTIENEDEQIYRRKMGLLTQVLNNKTRYTPILIWEIGRHGRFGRLLAEGSFDVSESGILVNDMALVGREDIVRVSGSALLDRDARSVSWLVLGRCLPEIGMYAGSVSHHENMFAFHTSVASDESSNQTDYSLTIDLQNSTKEGEIFAWYGKVELEVRHHPELSFRIDTEYNLTPKRSSGNIFRLCYNGTDCSSIDKKVILGHGATFILDEENKLYSHDMEVTYTHPAASQDISFQWTTSCAPGVSANTQLISKDLDNRFTTAVSPVSEGSSTNCTTTVLVTAPGYLEYGFTDIFQVSVPNFNFYPFRPRYGYLC